MSSILSYTAEFALEPFSAGFVWLSYHSFKEREAEKMKENLEAFDEKIVSIGQPIPDSVKSKITPLLEKFGIDKEKCIILHNKSTKSSAEVKGSLTHWGKFILLLNSDYVKTLENKSELSNKDKFIFAHELAHILRDDVYIVGINAVVEAAKNRLLAYTISCVALGILSPYGWLASHILGCCFAKVGGFLTKKKICRDMEFGADQLAASKSDEIARGALEFFTETQKETLEIKKEIQRVSEKRKKKLNLACLKLISDLPVFASKVILSSEGNYRLDFYHPPLSERKRKIKQMLSNSPNDKRPVLLKEYKRRTVQEQSSLILFC